MQKPVLILLLILRNVAGCKMNSNRGFTTNAAIAGWPRSDGFPNMFLPVYFYEYYCRQLTVVSYGGIFNCYWLMSFWDKAASLRLYYMLHMLMLHSVH